MEKNERSLYERFYEAVKKENLSKEIVLGLKRKVRGRPKKVIQELRNKPKKIIQKPRNKHKKIIQESKERKLKKYSYGNEFLTRDVLLQKPEILNYLRCNGKEKDEKVFIKDFIKRYTLEKLIRKS